MAYSIEAVPHWSLQALPREALTHLCDLFAPRPQLLLHTVCFPQSLSHLPPLNWHQTFSPILLLAQDGHQGPFKGLPESKTTRLHLSKRPRGQVFLRTATMPHHSPPALTISLFFKATGKELGGRKVKISLSEPSDPPPLRSGYTDCVLLPPSRFLLTTYLADVWSGVQTTLFFLNMLHMLTTREILSLRYE